MTKYCIRYHDSILYGYKTVHKKTNSFCYGKYMETRPTENMEPALFDTLLQAKLWVVCHSGFPKIAEYMFQLDEAKADTIIAKGKYKLNRIMLPASALDPSCVGTRWEHDNQKYPLLCELVIDDYPEDIMQ